ncbi:MAG: S46 family peptidase [Firmicutes bacterium]|nr:S46 family peptidase [Bacillota bacterium]
MKPLRTALLFALVLGGLRADEGMWTFDNLPLKKMKAAYGFAPDQAWLDHVRLSALHFGGGSGSFVSADGLAITNHHVGRGWIQQISGPGDKDYLKLGFVAKTRAEEIKVPGMTLRTLMRMENITDQVNAAAKPGMDEAQASEARDQAAKRLSDDLTQRTGLSVNVIRLYQGGEVWLYAYKVHKDVRLVMAPEMGIAGFGGDADNFTYPRFDMDFALFRVYENDKPYRPEHFLSWQKEGLKTGDLTFVVGHPGSTQRLNTYAQMLYARDTALPLRLASLNKSRQDMLEYASRSPEHARQVRTRIYSLENGLKAMNGYLRGLKDADALAEIQKREQKLRAEVAQHPALQKEVGGSWERMEEALKTSAPLAKENAVVNAPSSGPLATALTLVRLIEEPLLPEAQRLKGYRTESERNALLEGLDRPSRNPNAELDHFLLVKSLDDIATLKADHPFRVAVLGTTAPEAAAQSFEASKVSDSAFRKALLEGGVKALHESTDPAILAARRMRPILGDLAHRQEAAQAILTEHGARIARARFQVQGKENYPDATLTLRLTYGPVSTYPANGTLIQPFTTFHGLMDRALAWGPEAQNGAWALPTRWQERKDRLDLTTPFNFAHSVDIIGGNSGSPVLNTKGQFAGVIFDGNIEMLPGNFYYDGKVNRGVSLDARAILECLVKIYEAPHLVNELTAQ